MNQSAAMPAEEPFAPLQQARISTNLGHDLLRRFLSSALLAALILVAAFYGAFRPLDNWLEKARFAQLDRMPIGNIVFLEVDAASLQKVGVWPWPRTVHGAIVDRLSELGVTSIAFDIDFSSASTPANDAAFASAVKRAQGLVSLGTFEQSANAEGGKVINTPIPELAAVSSLVTVDVPVYDGNMVRDYPASRMVGENRIASMGQALGVPALRGVPLPEGNFGINFAIDLKAIDRISAADLLDGKVAPDRLRGHDVVIGASAQELRDFFDTPRFGQVPGALLHIMAAETLAQNMAMRDAPWLMLVGLIGALAALAASLGHRLSGIRWMAGALAFAFAVEAGALWLQHTWALRVTSAPIHIALFTFVAAAIVADLNLRRKLHAQAVRENEFVRAMLQQVVADDFDGVVIVDEAGIILQNSRMAQDLLNSHSSAPSLPPDLLKLVDETFAREASSKSRVPNSGQIAMRVKDSGLRYLDYVVTISAVDDQSRRRVACLTYRDVTQRRAEQEQLKFLASHDPSTGALLRHELIRDIDAKLDTASQTEPVTLVLIEIRNFNSITNAFGEAVGERVLQSVYQRLRAFGDQRIARIGDANFGLALSGVSEQTNIAASCKALQAILSEPFEVDERRITIGFDLGVAHSEIGHARAETLLAQARIAQGVARKGAANRYEIFSPVMEAKMNERDWMENALREAIAKKQFTLAYQPQFDLATGQCNGAEALIRWHHPERGFISPAQFIPVAEDTRLILEIGRWVLQTACQEAATWREHLNIAVNVSAFQLESPKLLADLRGALENSGLEPARLTVEITESAFVTGAEDVTELLDTLRQRGICIALDDFGTGYSSLGYLDRLPFDKLKIDQSFVKRMLDDAGTAAIVQSVLQLAQKLGKTVVAEGVETLAQAKLLQKFGCQDVQGYYFGKPMSAMDFRKNYGEALLVEGLEKKIS